MPNRLAHSTSPYLKQHAGNPVDWYPWGPEAFERARAEQKPIFLSIGYASCHWCHVMAHESFENAEVAKLLADGFVSVKVDREERPDVDRVYMAYVQSMTGHGGWPLSVWLTPELKPFFGGTYFPLEGAHGRAGFPHVLEAIAKAWREQREQLLAEGERALAVLAEGEERDSAAVGENDEISPALASEAAGRALGYLKGVFDKANGGFGTAPKFPQPGNLSFLLSLAQAEPDSQARREALEMAMQTLAGLALGGIHDHVGGGYHRYSVDGNWFLPHFEKMLYDQALLAEVAATAWHVSGERVFVRQALDIAAYAKRDLLAPGGGFYASEDADSADPGAGDAGEPREGAFYLWRAAELRELLGKDFEAFSAHFGVREEGNIPPELDSRGEFSGYNHLFRTEAPVHEEEPRVGPWLEKLRHRRELRPRPLRDEKIVAAWNGLMISALARLSLLPDEARSGLQSDPDAASLLSLAKGAANFLRGSLYEAPLQKLRRSWCEGVPGAWGTASDYACVIRGLLDLQEATGDVGWLRWAVDLQESFDAAFFDEENGGWFDAPAASPDLVLRLKEDYDGAEPAPVSLATANLLRLAALFGREDWRGRARRSLLCFEGTWSTVPQAMPFLLSPLKAEATWPPSVVVLAGEPERPAFRLLHAATLETPDRPPVVLSLATVSDEDRAWLAERAPWLASIPRRQPGAPPAAFVCRSGVCYPPVEEASKLRQLLQGQAVEAAG